MAQLGGGDSGHADEFAPMGLTGDDRHCGLGNAQCLREKLNARLIRTSLQRRSSEVDFERVSQFTGYDIAACSRLDLNSEGDAFGSFKDGNHVLYDKQSR